MANTEIIQNPQTRTVIRKLFSVSLLLSSLTMVAEFLLGATELHGKRVTLFSCIDSLLNITALSENAAYRTFLPVLISIFYFALMILIIKDVILSIRYFKEAYKEENDQKAMSALNAQLNSFNHTFSKTVFLIVTVGLLDGYCITTNGCIALALGIAVTILFRCVLMIWAKKNIKATHYQTVCNALFVIATFLFTVSVCKVQVSEFLSDLYYVLSEQLKVNMDSHVLISLFFKYLIEPLFCLVLLIFALRMKHYLLSYIDYSGTLHLDMTRKIFYGSIAYFAIACILNAYVYGVDSTEIYLDTFMLHIPMLATAIATRLIFTIPKYEPKGKCQTPDSPSEAPTDIQEEASKSAGDVID